MKSYTYARSGFSQTFLIAWCAFTYVTSICHLGASSVSAICSLSPTFHGNPAAADDTPTWPRPLRSLARVYCAIHAPTQASPVADLWIGEAPSPGTLEHGVCLFFLLLAGCDPVMRCILRPSGGFWSAFCPVYMHMYICGRRCSQRGAKLETIGDFSHFAGMRWEGTADGPAVARLRCRGRASASTSTRKRRRGRDLWALRWRGADVSERG